MEYRVTLTLAHPAIPESASLAETLDRAMDTLVRVAPASGPVIDAKLGEPGAHVTLTVDAVDVTEALNQATRLLVTAFLPLTNVTVEPVAEPA